MAHFAEMPYRKYCYKQHHHRSKAVSFALKSITIALKSGTLIRQYTLYGKVI